MPSSTPGVDGCITAAASFVYVVSLYCGAGYHDLPFETSTSSVVLGIDFEQEMRACFSAFHPKARVLNIDIGLPTIGQVIEAIRQLVPLGSRLHVNACLPCNHSSGASGNRNHYMTRYHVVVFFDIVRLLRPLYALSWFSENINVRAFKEPMKLLFPSAQHVVLCSSKCSFERRNRAYFASGAPIDLGALRALGAGGTVQACFNLPDGVYEMKSASTKYLAHEPSWKDVNSPSPTLTTNGLYLRRRDGTRHPWLLPGWALAQLRCLPPPPPCLNVVPQRRAVSRAVTAAVSVAVAEQVTKRTP